MKKTLIALLLSSMSTAYALEVSYGMAESSFKNKDETLKACTIAENLAIKDALMKYSGSEFEVNDETLCIDSKNHAYCDYLKEITSSVAGTVRSVIDRTQKVKNNTCFVEVAVEIEPSRQLNASVSTDRFYIVNDPLKFEVTTGEPLYLYVFNLHPNGVEVLFPNEKQTNALIDEKFSFPMKDLHVLATLDKEVKSNETMLYLFTKRRQDFDAATVSKDSLQELLKSIPNFEKKLIQHNIIIKRSER